jgi:uncharacterized protein
MELAKQNCPNQAFGIKSNGQYISVQKEHLREELIRELAGMECLLIAYSGGIDSTLLAVLAKKTLPERVRCILLAAPIVPRRGVSDAVENAHHLGLSCEIMPFPVMGNEEFRKNNPDRCYICKKLSARVLRSRAEKLGIKNVADGINASDLKEYRPGLKASIEEGIHHPFLMLGIPKPEIRQMAQDCGLGI